MNHHTDVLIYGGTPAGICAGIAAARRGRSVVILEPSAFIGGLMTSGLGETDIRSVDTSGSIFGEFLQKVYHHYVVTYGEQSQQVKDCNHGLRFEPSVAKKVMWDLLGQEANVQVLCQWELESIQTEGSAIIHVAVRHSQSGAAATYNANQFIDATYEADLAAMADVPYQLGRESRDEWNEEFAGKLYCEYRTKEVLTGSTGEGDELLQAYNFRLCMTDNPSNRVPFSRPDSYNRLDYISLIDDVAAERVKSFGEVIKLSRIPNGKTDTNNHHNSMCSTDLPEENLDYPNGSKRIRERIVQRHREYIQGLLWFLQNDGELPETFRIEAQKWGYAADEFEETGHFPPQIYVREARRINGMYVFTENDARLAPGLDRSPIHYDSIATGDYAIDSHATRKREEIGQNRALEGFLGFGALTEVYQIPFGIMVPEEISNLLVPVAVSATHMGFGTIRMEPFWMQLGYAAGIAADLSFASKLPVQQVCMDRLQDELIETNQLITYFRDVKHGDEAHQAVQYFGTKAYFTSYEAKPNELCKVEDAALWVSRARSLTGGCRIPILPATDQLAPAGIDIGPRKLTEEPTRRQYWESKPVLSRSMMARWLHTVSRSLGLQMVNRFVGAEGTVTRGEFLAVLYELLKKSRAQ